MDDGAPKAHYASFHCPQAVATLKMYHSSAPDVATCWYEVRDLQSYLFVGLTTTGYATSCNWVLDKMIPWQRQMTNVLDMDHLRKARRRGQCGEKRKRPDDDLEVDGEECPKQRFDEHAMSSYGFVWLLLHLMSESRHTDSMRDRARDLLQALAKKFLCDDISVAIVADTELRVTMGVLPLHGDENVRILNIDGGQLYVDELRRMGHNSLWRGVIDPAIALGGKVDFCDVLSHVFSLGRRTLWLSSQMINIIGVLMERDWATKGYLSDPFLARRVLRPGVRKDEEAQRRVAFGSIGEATVENSSATAKVLSGAGLHSCGDRPEDKQLVRYWLATRKAFDKQESPHVAVDSGRVGGTSWQMGAVQSKANGKDSYMVAWAPPQAGRDFKVSVAQGSPAENAEELEAWRSCAFAFLSNSEAADAATKPKAKGMERLASKDWLLRTDQQLQSTVGQGLSFWCRAVLPEDTDDEKHQQAAENACLGIHADRGPDGSCSIYYLLYRLKAAVVVFWDVNHDGHNDIVNAMRSTSDIYDRMVLNGVAFNVHWGPWSSQAWFKTCSEAAQEYAKLVAPGDPLFQWLLPQLLKDSGGEDEHCDNDGVQTIFEEAFKNDLFTKMGPKLQFSRYHSIVDVSEWWLPRWSGRLAVLVFMGITMGWLKKLDSGHLAPVLSQSKVRKESEKASSSKSTKGSVAATNVLRAKCHNQLHSAALIMLDPEQKATAQLVVSMTHFVRKWIGKKNKDLRTAAAAQAYFVEMANGEWLSPLTLTLGRLEDKAVLSDMGLTIAPSAASLALALDDPKVIAEGEHAKLIARYVFELLRRRFVRGAAHSFGFPLSFATFLGSDASQIDRVLALMKETDAAWQKAVNKTEPLIKKVVKRSSMQTMIVRTMFDHARKNNFSSVTADMLGLCRNIFGAAFGQTKVCEDSLKPCRAAEDHEQSSKTMRAERIFWQPIRHKILSELHHFDEVSPTDIVPHPRDPQRLHRSQYHPTSKTASTKALDQIAGSGSPSWATFNSVSASSLECDLVMLRYLNKHDLWDYAGLSWYAVLLSSGLIVRHKVLHRPDQWFLSLGHSVGLAAFVWPLTRVELSKGVWHFKFTPNPSVDQLEPLVVLDPKDWEAYVCPATAPLQSMLRKPLAKKHLSSILGVCFVVDGAAKPLLQVSAHNCFFDLPQICIKELCRTLGAEEPGDTLMTMLKSLIRHCAPKTSDNDMVDILSLRLKGRTENWGEFFEDEAMMEVFDTSDHSVLTEYIKDGEKKADSARAFQTEVHSYRKTVRGAGLKKSRKYPPAFPTTMSLDKALEVIPPGAKLSKDSNENRWRGAMRPFGTISRAWQCHGEAESLKLVARQLWLWHERATGEKCPMSGVV